MNKITSLNNGNSNNNQLQGKQEVELTGNDLTFIKCDCGSVHFKQGIKVGRLSKVHPKNPTGKTQIVHMPVTICMECETELDNKKLAE